MNPLLRWWSTRSLSQKAAMMALIFAFWCGFLGFAVGVAMGYRAGQDLSDYDIAATYEWQHPRRVTSFDEIRGERSRDWATEYGVSLGTLGFFGGGGLAGLVTFIVAKR
jgi:NADH:ubiquinone oxidoreductase subunit 5 (subunit L)/multisubunit Na+/H+ antiporter MnhA subunit